MREEGNHLEGEESSKTKEIGTLLEATAVWGWRAKFF